MNNDTYAVLADGQLQRTKTADNGIAYRRFDGHKKALATTAAQLGKLKPAIRNGISSVSYQPTKEYPDRVIIYMRDGNTVYGDLNTIGNKMEYYPAISASMKIRELQIFKSELILMIMDLRINDFVKNLDNSLFVIVYLW